MKTLIHNYSSTLSTEPMYIHRSLVEIGETANLWSNQTQSAFDTFDYFRPDLFVSHYKFLTHDILKYLSQTKGISLALNLTGASSEEIATVDSVIKSAHIDMPLVFTNTYEIVASNLEIKQLLPAADIFLPAMPTPEYEMETCIFALSDSKELSEIKSQESNYHTVGFTRQEENQYADMFLDVSSSMSFYHRYKKCIIVGDVNFTTSQILYDCMLKCKAINIKVPQEQQKVLDKRLASLFSESEGTISEVLKSQTKNKHNCIRRVARLFRLLKAKDISEKLERMSESI